jgi:hypothetical protein
MSSYKPSGYREAVSASRSSSAEFARLKAACTRLLHGKDAPERMEPARLAVFLLSATVVEQQPLSIRTDLSGWGLLSSVRSNIFLTELLRSTEPPLLLPPSQCKAGCLSREAIEQLMGSSRGSRGRGAGGRSSEGGSSSGGDRGAALRKAVRTAQLRLSGHAGGTAKAANTAARAALAAARTAALSSAKKESAAMPAAAAAAAAELPAAAPSGSDADSSDSAYRDCDSDSDVSMSSSSSSSSSEAPWAWGAPVLQELPSPPGAPVWAVLLQFLGKEEVLLLSQSCRELRFACLEFAAAKAKVWAWPLAQRK